MKEIKNIVITINVVVVCMLFGCLMKVNNLTASYELNKPAIESHMEAYQNDNEQIGSLIEAMILTHENNNLKYEAEVVVKECYNAIASLAVIDLVAIVSKCIYMKRRES